MPLLPFDVFLDRYDRILGEGAVIERLRRAGTFALDPQIVNAGFIYDAAPREALAVIYRQYLDIGRRYDLPLLVSTPTWRASRERITAAGCAHRDVNGDNFRFLDALRRETGDYAAKVAVAGLLSCRGDAYAPGDALATEAAHAFHRWQAGQLAAAGVDCLMGATLPALDEAVGLAAAMAATGTPYLVSFVLRPAGTLLDGTPLKTAVAAIDAQVTPKPLAFLANCTHASFFRSALCHPTHSSNATRARVAGLLANTAALEPEALDNHDTLVAEAPEAFGRSLAGLHRELGIKLLGGCCGTDDRHIAALAARLADKA